MTSLVGFILGTREDDGGATLLLSARSQPYTLTFTALLDLSAGETALL